MARVFLGLGSNLGERKKNLREALQMTSTFSDILSISSTYETEPIGIEDQPDFLNCVVEVKTELPPGKLLLQLKAVEDQMGFGTDREQLKKVLTDISGATQGEVICYSPSYFKNENFYRASKVRGDRKVTHTGKNIEIKPATMKSDFKSSYTSPMIGNDFNDKTNSFESDTELDMEADWEVLPPVESKSFSSSSVQSDFSSLFESEKEKPKLEIDLSKYESVLETESQGVKSPIMGIGMIMALAGGLFVVAKGLRE